MPAASTPEESFTLPGASAKPGMSGGTTITGTLGWNDVEGGCPFVQAADGMYEVTYPDGWAIDRSTGALHGPSGEVVPLGGTITLKGAVATDMASICQIGQIFVATHVEVAAP